MLSASRDIKYIENDIEMISLLQITVSATITADMSTHLDILHIAHTFGLLY